MNAADDHVADAAQTFFDRVVADLLKFGGVREDITRPLRKDHLFASAVFDELTIILARKYASDELDFEMADWLANIFEGELEELILTCWPKEGSKTYPFLWGKVYEAFDAGEHDHFGRSQDPVREYTDPEIAEFLAKHGTS